MRLGELQGTNAGHACDREQTAVIINCYTELKIYIAVLWFFSIFSIRDMVNTIRCGYFSKSKWIDTFKAADVVGENAWIGATLVVGIYAADFAEIVFGRMCIELIQSKQLFTLKDA